MSNDSLDLIKSCYELRERAKVAETKAELLEAENKRLVELVRILSAFPRLEQPSHPIQPMPWPTPGTGDPIGPYPVTCSASDKGVTT